MGQPFKITSIAIWDITASNDETIFENAIELPSSAISIPPGEWGDWSIYNGSEHKSRFDSIPTMADWVEKCIYRSNSIVYAKDSQQKNRLGLSLGEARADMADAKRNREISCLAHDIQAYIAMIELCKQQIAVMDVRVNAHSEEPDSGVRTDWRIKLKDKEDDEV